MLKNHLRGVMTKARGYLPIKWMMNAAVKPPLLSYRQYRYAWHRSRNDDDMVVPIRNNEMKSIKSSHD